MGANSTRNLRCNRIRPWCEHRFSLLLHADTEEVDSALLGEGEIDWLSLQQSAKRCKVIQLEDRVSKAVRLRNEGVVLAEQER